MATLMLMHWPEVTSELYQQVRQDVNWEGDVPKGAKFHVAWFGTDGFHVLDLWESMEDFDAFARTRLNPVTEKLGLATQPSVEFAEPESVFAPNP